MISGKPPTYEELLRLLEDQGPNSIPLVVEGFIDLSEPMPLLRFAESLVLPLVGDVLKQERDKGVKITLHDYASGRELHVIVNDDIETVARRIERTVFRASQFQDKPEYLPYFVVMYDAFTRGNLRGQEFNDLLNRIAWLYADHQGYKKYNKDHLNARKRIKKWIRGHLGRIFRWNPQDLQNRPPWDASTYWVE